MEELSRASDDPTVSGVVLTGPAGVGKTRLGDELLVAAAGKPTARAVGHVATRRIHLGAFAQLLGAGALRQAQVQRHGGHAGQGRVARHQHGAAPTVALARESGAPTPAADAGDTVEAGTP